ncbi:transmembrane protein 265-like isoform X1 [Syngnathus acus]|uniref:transmembrane protein 265-like isoform X1 n=2 Tax=Syngnathus acus TaxID=161584 RepID=UPI001885BDD7|nr:transmembrane protein 265-like isoform X1 [Syngnathus acus]
MAGGHDHGSYQTADMSDSPLTCVKVDEEMSLNTVPGSAGPRKSRRWAPRKNGICDDKYHRRLAVWSIVCGVSCIGIQALINSVKAEMEPKQESAARLSRRARRLGIISIVALICILILIPVLMALFSYLVTLKN